MLRTERGEVTKGTIELDGERLDGRRPRVVRRGVSQVFEGRRVFENLTAEENLIAGAHIQRGFPGVQDGIDVSIAIFRCSRSAVISSPDICPAASSRCW